ncbi:unnamed protein product [Rotaria sp. Silwood2]|nr:unnamed protein product [Rotaria sp. Silwood2]
MDYTIGEMETLRSGNEQKIAEIQRINSQLNKALETQTEVQVENEDTNDAEDMDTGIHDDEDLLTIENIIFAGSDRKKCVICKAEVNTGTTLMPKLARLDMLVLKRMYAPHGVRCCKDHLWNNPLLPDVKINMQNRRKVVSRTFDSIRQVLKDKLVPNYPGTGNLSRLEAIDHNTSFPNEFFGQNVTIIWDGTYFYTGKSSSHEFQRSTYSGQKKRHLVKFMSLCLPDGYCLDTLGPFLVLKTTPQSQVK